MWTPPRTPNTDYKRQRMQVAGRVGYGVARYAARAGWRRMAGALRSRAGRNIALGLAASYGNKMRSGVVTTARKLLKFGARSSSKVKSSIKSTAGGGSARYRGRFRKAKRVSKSNKYVKKGFENTTEVNGTVSDPDVVYVGATCAPGRVSVEAVAQALLRRVLEKCIGIPVTNVKTVLQGYYNSGAPTTEFNNGDGFRFSLTSVNINTGVINEQTYETVPTDSIYSICGEEQAGVAATWPNFILQLLIWAAGTTNLADNANQPHMLRVYRRDGNVTNFYLGSGAIDLRTTTIHFKSSISLKLQNRSLSATGGNQADDVNNNPLMGYKYEFKGGSPMFKDNSATGMYRVSRMFENTGTCLARGASMTGIGSIGKEPPKPQFWTNCVKSSKVTLDPGDLKQTYLSYSFSLNFIKALQRINAEADNTTDRVSYRNPGKCVMFALEDMINVNAANLIAVAYEVNRVIGCYATDYSKTEAQGSFTALTRNEV